MAGTRDGRNGAKASESDGSRSLHAFHATSILIVEDEFVLSLDLARRFEAVGAMVIGPVASVRGALDKMLRVGTVGAAVLDIRLGRENVFPLADLLADRSIPFVFYSAYEQTAVPERFRDRRYLRKLDDRDAIVWAVLAERAIAECLSEDMVEGLSDDYIVAWLPRLRLTARILAEDRNAADDLLERALNSAITSIERKPAHVSAVRWTLGLLEKAWLQTMIRPKPN